MNNATYFEIQILLAHANIANAKTVNKTNIVFFTMFATLCTR